MKKIFYKTLLASFIFTCFNSLAQEPQWQWAKSFGGPGWDEASCIAADKNGNLVMCGFFESTSIRFGLLTLQNPSSQKSLFIVQLDGSGKTLWAKAAGSSRDVYAESVALDKTGNIYVCGFFNGPSLTFNSTLELKNNYSSSLDFFVAKFNPNGTPIWAKNIGNTQDDGAYDLCVDAKGNVYVTGYTSGPIFTDNIRHDEKGSYDYFLVKYDPAGKILWSKSAGGYRKDWGFGVTTDKAGNVYVTGRFESAELDFGNFKVKNASDGIGDAFVVKYDENGKEIFAKSFGGDTDDGGNSITVDPNGNIFITGYMLSKSITADGFTLNNGDRKSQYGHYLICYKESGDFNWLKKSEGYNITCSEQGGIFTTGKVDGPMVENKPYTPRPSHNLYLAEYDRWGNLLWEKIIPDNDWAEGNSILQTKDGSIYVTGFFCGNNFVFGNTTLTNKGWRDIFIAKLKK
jgi:hypothetical protein